MGVVYLARDVKLGRRVALKFIKADAVGSDESVRRFLKEARATAKFNHPHIITIYTVGGEESIPYVALEYLEGQSLYERMMQEKAGPRETLRIGLAIAQALEEAHGWGILHRDLKPENIMLPRDGRLRVLDFGLARAFQVEVGDLANVDGLAGTLEADILDTPDDKEEKGIQGTPTYMAPEQWKQEATTGAADIWALGTILFEMITGHRPYQEDSFNRLFLTVCSGEPAPSLDPSLPIPRDLHNMISRCLDKDPANRPSASEVAGQLQSLLQQDRKLLPVEGNPFRGLLPFDERHQHFFFGRETEIASFVERLRHRPVLPIIGPSGAGKSSFILAGVIPRLREHEPIQMIQMRPGNFPFLNLANGLATAQEDTSATEGGTPERGQAVGRDQMLQDTPTALNLELQRLAEMRGCKVLLIVDQLEELYTMVQDGDVRSRFMQVLCNAADDPQLPVRVIFTLREEFISRLAEGPGVEEALSHITVMRRPGPEALMEALSRPVEAQGYRYEDPSLVQEMVQEVQGEFSCLPLMQFAGQMLWDRRDQERKVLTRKAYEEVGGVAGALAQHADGVLKGLLDAERQLARTIFLRLVTDQGTRRVLSHSEVLEGLGERAERVLDRLTDARLISMRQSERGEAEVELVHESLVNAWGRLSRWIEGSREELAFLLEVRQAATLWQRRGARKHEVWRGDALRDALHQMERCTTEVPEGVKEFLQTGEQRERRRAWRKRAVVTAGFAALLVVALAFWVKEREALQQQRLAQEQRAAAVAQRAYAQLEGARSALSKGDLLQARAKLRASLETKDSLLGRALWWKVSHDPLEWRKDLGSNGFDVAFSPDGKTIAVAAGQEKVIHLFDSRSMALRRTLRGHKDQVLAVAFSGDGRKIASGSWSGEVRLWDLEESTEKILAGHKAGVWSLAFSSDGRLLATGSMDRTLRIWDIRSGGKAKVLRGHTKGVLCVTFKPGTHILATGSLDRSVRIWDLDSAKQVKVFKGHQNSVSSVAFNPGGRTLASGSKDRTIRIWDVAMGKVERILQGHQGGVRSLSFSPDGKLLASGSRDETIRIWDPANGTQQKTLKGHSALVVCVRFHPKGFFLASSSSDKSVRLWNLSALADSRATSGHQDSVWFAGFSPDKQTLASAGKDRTIRIWDVATGQERQVLRGHKGEVRGVTFSPGGKVLASGSWDKTIKLWNPISGNEIRELNGHLDGVSWVAFSPDGKVLASGSRDRTIRIWDPFTGSERRVLRGHNNAVAVLSFSPDGKLLASGSRDRTIRIWDTSSGKVRRVLEGHTALVFGLAFAPDGEFLVSGSWDRTIRLWDLKTGHGRIFGRHRGRVYRLSVSPDGHWIGAPASNKIARIWNVRRGNSIVLRGHQSEVNSLRFSHDGKLVVTASDDGTVRVWDAESGEPFWRTTVLLSSRGRIHTHRGWEDLVPSTDAAKVAGGQKSVFDKTKCHSAIKRYARLASESRGGEKLCLLTQEQRLEMWDMQQDRLLFQDSLAGQEQVLALPQGCLTRAGGAVRLYNKTGAFKLLEATGATAVSIGQEAILVVTERQVITFDFSGARKAEFKIGAGVRAGLISPVQLTLGFEDGNIEVVSLSNPGEKLYFRDMASSPVTRLLEGPTGTVIVGHANGQLGIWNLKTGLRLYHARLHGPVGHLQLRNSTLYAASELGDKLVKDLSVFKREYCDLVQEVWQRVPVTWESGLPRLRPPPERHRCRPTR